MKGLIHPSLLGAALVWFLEDVTQLLPGRGNASCSEPAVTAFQLWFEFLIIAYLPGAFLHVEDDTDYHLRKFAIDLVEGLAIVAIFILGFRQVPPAIWIAYLALAFLGLEGLVYHVNYTKHSPLDKGLVSVGFTIVGIAGSVLNAARGKLNIELVECTNYILLFVSYGLMVSYYLAREKPPLKAGESGNPPQV